VQKLWKNLRKICELPMLESCLTAEILVPARFLAEVRLWKTVGRNVEITALCSLKYQLLKKFFRLARVRFPPPARRYYLKIQTAMVAGVFNTSLGKHPIN
jgi:hypothetical protein